MAGFGLTPPRQPGLSADSEFIVTDCSESLITMVRGSKILLISNTLSELLVCPLSKQPLRVCEKTNSLISDAIGVSFPIVDGIPCLVPKDGKIIEADDDTTNPDGGVDVPDTKKN